MQNHYNLIYREEEREMIPFCLDRGVGLTPWSPLARGFLAGNRRRDAASGKRGGDTRRAAVDGYAHSLYYDEADFRVVERLDEVARKRGALPAQVALAWLLGKPGVTSPVVGATKLEQLEELAAAAAMTLDAEEVRLLEEPYVPHRVLGHE
jgi:aryl-alcohol dehydrogenase (NADP+)